tara:strand:- start:918 stop:1310 length:393 start_codon:yes stop_codon:yes gene_type:complete
MGHVIDELRELSGEFLDDMEARDLCIAAACEIEAQGRRIEYLEAQVEACSSRNSSDVDRIAELEREVQLARDAVVNAEKLVHAAQTDYYEARRRAVALREALEDVLGWQSLAPAGVLDRARAVLTQEEGG